jgi:hypothetical protein
VHIRHIILKYVRRRDIENNGACKIQRRLMQLFISYARENIAKVRETVEILTAGGHTVWFDDQLLPGQDWKRQLGESIARCDAFVYVMTREAVTSEWCEWELATAVRLEKALIPVLLETGISVPDSLRRLQYADFTQGTTPIAVAKLMGALAIMQKIPVAESPALPADPKGIPSRAWKHWTNILMAQVHQPQNQAEELIAKFAANLWRGNEAVGGRMLLTNQRVLFEAHKMNVQTTPVAIPLSAIKTVVPSVTFGIVPNGVTIRCDSGEEYQFVVWDRKRIISKIEECRSRIRDLR